MNTETLNKDAYFSAIRMLSRREYSAFEIKQKLLLKEFSEQEIVDVLLLLQAENYQSDARYTEMLVRSRQNQGRGPVRIRQELQEKQVADQLIEEHLDETDDYWFELAKEVREKKFGSAAPEDFAAQAKQMKFLQYRGFTMRQISAMFS
jgi:regulatory protein